MIKTYKQQI